MRGKLATIRRIGFRRSARIALDTAALTLLRRRYGFAEWHAHSPTSARPYRGAVAAMARTVQPRTVVEVGCGLGAVLARIGAPDQHGYDTDAGVIRAARLLHGRAARFSVGSFADVVEPSIDLLVALCWIHEFPPEQVEAWLTPLLARTRHLLIDQVSPTSPQNLRFNHDFAFLNRHADIIASDPCGEDHRRFLLYRVRR